MRQIQVLLIHIKNTFQYISSYVKLTFLSKMEGVSNLGCDPF